MIAEVAAFAVLTMLGAAAPAFPETADEFYEMGKRFATCGAHWSYYAEIAEQADKPESKAWGEGTARGWRAAGMLFMLQGLEREVQPHAADIFDSLVEIQLTDFRSRAELGGAEAVSEIVAEYSQNCGPLVPLQEATIDVLRRDNFGARD